MYGELDKYIEHDIYIYTYIYRRPYSCLFVGCCLQDLFNTARSILVQLPSSFFSIHLVSVYVTHPYRSGGARGVSGGARGVSGGARGVMVIVAGCGLGDTSSNPGRD